MQTGKTQDKIHLPFMFCLYSSFSFSKCLSAGIFGSGATIENRIMKRNRKKNERAMAFNVNSLPVAALFPSLIITLPLFVIGYEIMPSLSKYWVTFVMSGLLVVNCYHLFWENNNLAWWFVVWGRMSWNNSSCTFTSIPSCLKWVHLTCKKIP